MKQRVAAGVSAMAFGSGAAPAVAMVRGNSDSGLTAPDGT